MAFFKKFTFAALLSLLCFALFSTAQAQETNITINIKNQLGEVIPDAEISLFKADQKEKTIKTNKQGVAHFQRLTGGTYQVNVTAAGFRDYISEEILVKTGEVKKLEITLEVATFETNVSVGNDETIDPENSGAARVLTEKQLENLPDDPKELERVLKQMAGESVTGEELPISVNGIQGGKVPPKQAIQQIRINQNVFSSQYEGPYGGGIEIFTRSNIDKFGGYIGFNFADSRFNATDPFIGKRIPLQSRGYFFNFQGPIINKRTSFFMYGNHSEADSSSVINATVLNAAFVPTAFQQTFASPTRNENIYFVLNSDPTKKHKISINYNLNLNRARGQNVGNFSLPSRENRNNSQYHGIQFSDTYLANENVVNQTRFSITFDTNKNFGGSNEAAINVQEAFYGGGSQSDSYNKNLRFEGSNDTTWQMGKYAMGFGWRFRGERVNQVSMANFGGTYTFSGGIAPVLDANNNPVIGGGGNVVTAQINSLERYRRTLLLRQLGFTSDQIRQRGGGADQFSISGGNPQIKASQYDFGFYFQNSYKLSETIAASFGVRYENQTNIDSNLNFSPRLGLIWSPKAKEKQKPLYQLPRISVGVGMFYNRFALSNWLNVLQANDADRAQYLITDASVLDLYPNVPSINLLQQFALAKNRRFIDAALETPYQALFNISAAKKMPKGFTLNFNVSRTKSLRQSLTQNINAPLAGTFDPLNKNLAAYPFGTAGNIYQTFSDGRAESTRFSVNLNFPNSQNLYGFIGYSFLKAKNNVVGGSGSPFDPYNFNNEYGPTNFDGMHRVSGFFSFSLPYGFNMNNDFQIASGTRFNITTGRDTNGDGFYNERPAYASNPNKAGVVSTQYGLLDPNPLPGDSIIPRNLGRGPAIIGFNSGFGKAFKFGEDVKNKKPAKQTIYVGIRVQNVLNIVNRGNPISNMTSPNFLRYLSGNNDSSGGIIIINGVRQTNGGGRSINFNVGFAF